MEDLTTPHKKRGYSTISNLNTDTDFGFTLSPFLPQGSQFYASLSPFQPAQISYVSPMRTQSRPRIGELLINFCDQLGSHIYCKNAALSCPVKAVVEPELKKDTTPPKCSEVESTCEGSDLKVPKLDLQEGQQEINPFVGELTRKRRHHFGQDRLRLTRTGDKIGSKIEDRIIRRRKRKSIEQLKMLVNEYKKNPNWNKNTMSEVAKRTGLSEAQVYKWSWDQKKKKFEE